MSDLLHIMCKGTVISILHHFDKAGIPSGPAAEDAFGSESASSVSLTEKSRSKSVLGCSALVSVLKNSAGFSVILY